MVSVLPLLFVLHSACQEYELVTEPPVLPGGDSADQPQDSDPIGVPDIEVDPLEDDHGVVEQGTALQTVLTVSNTGDADLTLGTVTSSWALSSDLAGVVLAPGDELQLTASTNAVYGTHTEPVALTSDDPDEPTVEVWLHYESIDPCSWDGWRPDDDCGGGWGGTASDGEASLDGEFAPETTILTADSSGGVLVVEDSAGFTVDDELFLHARDGRTAWARVVAVADTLLSVEPEVELPSGTAVQRVPHYTEVSVGGELSGSRIVFRACGAVTVDGVLTTDGGGWRGGRRATLIPELGWQGDSELGAGTQSDSANGTAGGGGADSCNVHADGGGGGHATEGTQGGDWDSYSCGGPGGQGGGTNGDEALTTLNFGGAGGSGYLDNDASTGSFGGAGGAGGGIVRIVATGGFSGQGVIRANGSDGEDGYWIAAASPGGGGAGAGGSILLVGDVGVDLEALGGAGGIGSEAGNAPTEGGLGGQGRIRVDGVLNATAIPDAYEGCP